MINKETSIDDLKDILNEYKNNIDIVSSEFLKIYSYVVDNNIVSFIIFNIMYEKCEIVHIFTKEEYRRRQIAQKLILEILNDFSLENITLEVSEKNLSAIKLYEKLGFKKVAIRKNYYNDSNGILMLKEVR